MRRLLIVLLACVLLPASVSAQSTTTIAWDYLNVTPAVVATYTQTLTVDGTVATSKPACTAAGTGTTCRQSVPLLAPGAHTIVVEATLNSVTASTSASINPASGPRQPSAVRIEVTVVVQTP